MAEIDDFLDWLACPVCGGLFARSEDGLTCERGHTSDVAKQGYANLLGPRGTTHTADDSKMLDARYRVLGAGLFDPMVDAIRNVLRVLPENGRPGPILDLGTGTGFHLERALEELPDRLGLGLDNSKFAARRAARCHPRSGAVVADVWAGIPIQDRSVSVLLDVFAPRNGPEIERVLAPDGVALVVTAGSDHLAGMPQSFGMITVDPEKEERLERTMASLRRLDSPGLVEWSMALSPTEVADLAAMGPAAGRVDEEGLEEAVGTLARRTEVEGQVEIHLFGPEID
jgi:23S rRNA (guanine745-N1)-methyltransferase